VEPGGPSVVASLLFQDDGGYGGVSKKIPAKNAAHSGVFCGDFLYRQPQQVALSQAKGLLIYYKAPQAFFQKLNFI